MPEAYRIRWRNQSTRLAGLIFALQRNRKLIAPA